jgi:hypothetical protein
LFGLALGVYLFTSGGSLTSTDAVVAFDVTQNLVRHGTVATSGTLLTYDALRGRDGRYYSPFGVAQSLYNVPFYLAGTAFIRTTGVTAGKPDTIPKAVVALGQTLVVAFIVWQVFHLSLMITGDVTSSSMAALTAAFGTVLWPYARFGFNQPLACATLVGATTLVLSGARQGEMRQIGLAGWVLALGLMTRHEMAVAFVPVALWLAASAKDQADRIRRLRAVAPGLAAGVVTWMLFNAIRFGHPLDSGHLRDTVPGFGSPVVEGLAGLLFSPAASIFLYSPVTVLGIVGLCLVLRTDRSAAVLLLSLTIVFALLYSTLGNWLAGRSYGSRYLLIVVPLLVAGWAVVLARLTPVVRLWVFAAVTTIGVLVQVPGVLMDYAKVSQAAAIQNGALSTADRQWAWRASPLVLNAQALVTAVPDNISYVVGRVPPPAVAAPAGDDDRGFSQQFAFSLDFWWLYLFYLGLLPSWALLLLLVAAACWVILCGRHLVRAIQVHA